ncbi:MAG: CBS domain-containing protein [Pirellulaceae bacterium]
MIICPYCDCENITGADECEQCGQALSDLNLPTPATYVERCVLRDRLGALGPARPVAVVAPETKIRDVLSLLAQRSIGCVVVTQDERIVGIFSERDVVIKLNTQAVKFRDRPVSEFMTRDPQCLDSEAKVAFAIHRMSIGGYRHVPVTDANGTLRSMVSVRDVLRYLTEKMAQQSPADPSPL